MPEAAPADFSADARPLMSGAPHAVASRPLGQRTGRARLPHQELPKRSTLRCAHPSRPRVAERHSVAAAQPAPQRGSLRPLGAAGRLHNEASVRSWPYPT